MGAFADFLEKKKRKSSSGNDYTFDYTANTQGLIDERKNLYDQAIQKGLTPEQIPDVEQRSNPGFLDRMFGVLSAGETAPAVMKFIKTGDVGQAAQEYGKSFGKRITGQGYRDDPTYADVLKELGFGDSWVTKGAGLLGDIFLDPTTYIPIGAAVKGVSKTAKLAEGTSKVGKFLRKSEKAGKLLDTADSTIKGVTDLFKPGAKIERTLGSEAAGAYLTAKDTFLKGSRYASGEQLNNAINLAQEAVGKTKDKNIGSAIANFIETGGRVDDIVIDPLINEARKYKSADEFVKAQGTPVYHGTRDKIDKFDLNHLNATYMHDGLGINFTDKKDFAHLYSRGKNEWGEIKNIDDNLGYVHERYIKGKVLDLTSGDRNIGDVVSRSDFEKLASYGRDKEWARKNLERLVRNSFGSDVSSRDATKIASEMSDKELVSFAYNRLKDRPMTSGEGLPDFFRQLIDVYGFKDSDKAEVVKQFSKLTGYDYIKTPKKSGSNVFTVLNPDKLLTKSQLTDIWNQATRVGSAINLAREAVGKSKDVNIGSALANFIETGGRVDDIIADPLLNEARKYKSAEEFVKAYGAPVYHGGSKIDGKIKVGDKGFSVTTDRSVAELGYFGGSFLGGKGTVNEFVIEPSAKILSRKDIPEDVFKQYKNARTIGDESRAERMAVEFAKKNGYDAVDWGWIENVENNITKPGFTEYEIKIVNPSVLKTKSQLTDIWNQATRVGSKMDIKGTDNVAKSIMDNFAQMLDKEKKAGLTKSEIANYVPHMLTDEAQKFLSKTGDAGKAVQRFLNTRLPSSSKRTLEGTITDINKVFQKETGLGFDLFEPDVFKILAKRGVSSERAIAASEFFKGVKKNFGLTEKQMVEKGGVGFHDTRVVDGIKYKKYDLNGALQFFPTEIMKASGEVGQGLGVARKKGVYLPEVIVKDLNESLGVFSSDEKMNAVLKAFDTVQGIWKKNVTGMFPAFHLRNLFGGFFGNWITGVNNPKRYEEAISMYRGKNIGEIVAKIDGKEQTYGALMDVLKKRGAISPGQGAFDVFEQIGKASSKELDKVIGKGIGGKGKDIASFIYNTYPEKANEFIESTLRGALAIDLAKKGHSMDDIVKQVFKVHFDYAPESLTTFERKFLKRVIPFYTWTKNNAGLQFETMLKSKKYKGVAKAYRDLPSFGTGGDVTKDLPPYMTEGSVVGIGGGKNDKGEALANVLYGFGLPFEDINQLDPMGIASKLSPAIKTPIELGTGQSFFYKKPIEDTYSTAPTMIKNAPQPIKDALGYTEIEQNGRKIQKVDPVKFYLMTQLAGRYFYTAENLVKPETQAALKALQVMTGVKGKTVNIPQQKYYAERDKTNALSDFLYNKGVAKRFTKTYIPKE